MSPRTLRRAVRIVKRTALYATAVAVTVLAIIPFYWMFLTMFKQDRDLYVGGTVTSHIPWGFNAPPTLAHVSLLFTQTDYVRWVGNTVLVGLLVVAITVAFSLPAGYALTKLAGSWGEPLGIGIFLTYLVPPTLLFIPFARVVAWLHLTNTLWSLVLVYPTFTIPFCTWLMMGFFRTIPRDLEEQGMIDGYSRLAVIRTIVVPLALSGTLTVVVFAFTLVIQEFVYALTFISSVERMTISLGIPVALVRGDVFYWGSLMAAALITSIPIAAGYNLLIDRFIKGFTGAIKG